MYLTKDTKSKSTRISKVSKTLNMPLTFFAQLEEIRNKLGRSDFEDTLIIIVNDKYRELGFGLP